MPSLEETLREAFERANDRRQEAGLHAQILAKKDVIKKGAAKGLPRGLLHRYKLTQWLAPWDYTDLLRLKEYLGWSGGPTGLIAKLIRDALPAHLRSARPEERQDKKRRPLRMEA